jgi:hypothetical protein
MQRMQIHHVLLGERSWIAVVFHLILALQPACQKQDWPRHKKEPCAPIEDIVANDELWNPMGTRIGTGWYFKDLKDIRRHQFHKDA